VAPELGPDRQLEKILSRAGELKTHAAPVLELNPGHGLIKALAEKATTGGDAAVLDDAAVILYGEAKILDGEPPDDPSDHAARIARLIEKSLA
jgi:molecular chaperone HtpG